jgi:hypothetical protein
MFPLNMRSRDFRAFAENSCKMPRAKINHALTKDSIGIDGKLGLPLRLRKADAAEENAVGLKF